MKKKDMLKRLFSVKNIVPIMVIALAFLGTFIQRPFGLDTEQILLTLLGFLAIDALVERLEILGGIEGKIDELKREITTKDDGNSILKYRHDFPRLELELATASKEICISGLDLNAVANATGVFERKLQEGLIVKFLAIIPEDSVIQDTSNYRGMPFNDFKRRLIANLSVLDKKLVQKFPKQAFIRVITHRPSIGYFIVDPNENSGRMNLVTYLYQQPDDRQPILHLKRKLHSHWFECYVDEFNQLWKTAEANDYMSYIS